MSVGLAEKQVRYDNPCAPIVRFSPDNIDDDMTDDPTLADTPFDSTLGEHSFKSLSLEDLIQSFDNTINTCFSEQQQQQLITREEEPLTPVSASNTWTNLIDNLRTSLRHDLKLPHLADQCQSAMQKAHETNDALPSMDDVDESELREQFDMHSVLVSANSYALEPFLTAEQVISEIDFMLQDMTPDSGYCDDRSTTDLLDLHSRRVEYLLSTVNNDEFDLKAQSVYSLNEFVDELNRSIKDLSSILVQELAARDELEYDKETKNTFISLVHSIQTKRQQHQTDKRPKRRSLLGMNIGVEPGTYLTTVIPFDREHATFLSVEHLQSLNKILRAINDDSSQVPELLTNYILKVLCPC